VAGYGMSNEPSVIVWSPLASIASNALLIQLFSSRRVLPGLGGRSLPAQQLLWVQGRGLEGST
jgi:hypothetical protein